MFWCLPQIFFYGLYALLTQVSINYFSLNGRISLIWVPGGFALAAILLVGKRYAWSVLVGEVIGVLFRGGVLSAALPMNPIPSIRPKLS